MNAGELLQHYDRIADAADAIERLRQFVVDLAVRGKLVQQNSDDEHAAGLLIRIAAERKTAGISEPDSTKQRADQRPPFALPTGWASTTIANVLIELQTGPFGSSLHQTDYQIGGTPVINPASIQAERIVPIEKMAVGASTLERLGTFKVLPGDIIMARRGEMGRCAVVTEAEHGWLCGTGSLILRQSRLLCPRFLVLLIGSPFVREYLSGAAVGTTMQNLNQGILLKLAFGLPPTAEQHRIVAKVDELMALCDRLEAARAEREAARDRLASASLARLNVPDPETFAEDARFALDALPVLAARPDQIKQLRQTILGLAVRGRLIPQVATDAPAVELLAAIEQRRSDLLLSNYPNAEEARAQIRKQSDQNVPSGLDALPTGWAWATLMQCALLVVDCKNKTAPYAGTGVRLVRTTNVRDGRLNSLEPKFVSPETYEVWSARCKPAAGDILITREAPMGEVCIIPENETLCLGQRMMLVRLVEQTIDPAFLLYSLRDPYLMNRVQDKPIGATVQHLRVGGVETLLVPLPPLAEQRRIVARLDELMTICDQLEASLAACSAKRTGLMEALLQGALRPVSPLEEAA